MKINQSEWYEIQAKNFGIERLVPANKTLFGISSLHIVTWLLFYT